MLKKFLIIFTIMLLIVITACKKQEDEDETPKDQEPIQHVHEYVDDVCSCGDVKIQQFTVKFYDFDNNVISTQTVNKKASAVAPNVPSKQGYIFNGWSADFSCVTSDLNIYPKYIIEEPFSYNVHEHEYEEKHVMVSCCSPEYIIYDCIHCDYFYCDVQSEKLSHQFVNDICLVCNAKKDQNGLIFKLDSKLNEYSVIGYEGENKHIKHLVIPDEYNSLPVTSIGSYAFDDYQLYVQDITIPASVKKIGYDAFRCELEYIMDDEIYHVYYKGTIKEWCEIDFDSEYSNPIRYCRNSLKMAFYVCDNDGYQRIENLNIPYGVTKIKPYTFANFHIDNLSMADSVIEICHQAFTSTKIKSISFSSSLQVIGQQAFYQTNGLEQVILPDSLEILDKYAFYECSDIKELYIGTNLKILAYPVLSNYKKLTKISVNENNQYFKYENGGLYSKDGKILILVLNIDNIELSSSITKICKGAFESIGKTDTTCNIYYDSTVDNWLKVELESSTSNPLYQMFYSLTRYQIRFYLKDSNNTYYDLSACNELVIPDGTTKIGQYHFYGYTIFKNIILPNSLESIVDEWINLDSVESIYYKGSTEELFQVNTNLIYQYQNLYVLNGNEYELVKPVDFVIPDGIKEIDLAGYQNIKSVYIPASVIDFGYWYNMDNLENIYYYGTIEDWCKINFTMYQGTINNPMVSAEHFYLLNEQNEWYELTELVIPDTITEIGDFQFCGFDNLTKVYLPSTVQKIGRFGLGIDSKGTIYCEVNTKPNDWVNEWNQYYDTSYNHYQVKISWGYTE